MGRILFPTKINKVDMKDKPTKKDIRRISQHILKHKPAAVWSQRFLPTVLQCFMRWMLTGLCSPDVVLWQPVY